jgi:nitrogen fixation NifU-like protein
MLRCGYRLRKSKGKFLQPNLVRTKYHSRILERVENPTYVGKMDPNDPKVGTGLVGAPACGDVMKLQIKVEGNIIQDAKFKTFGCGSAIASSDYLSETLIGKTLEEAKIISNQDIANYLCLPPVKLHCSALAEEAVKQAIKDYTEKYDYTRE